MNSQNDGRVVKWRRHNQILSRSVLLSIRYRYKDWQTLVEMAEVILGGFVTTGGAT